MHILYYSWQENCREDVLQTLKNIGHEVTEVTYDLKDFLNSPEFVRFLETKLAEKTYDCIVTMNYFPVISKVSFRQKIPYVAWVFDSPCLTVYSEMAVNPYNYIFHFDRSEVERIREMGVQNIFHMPLGVNIAQVNNVIAQAGGAFYGKREAVERGVAAKLVNSGVSFLGNLYNDQYNFLDQIQGVTDYEKGMIDGLIDAQLCMFGCDLLSETIPDSLMEQLLSKVSFSLSPELRIAPKTLLLQMIQRKATVVERRELLEMISKQFPTTLYSHSDASALPNVDCRGYLSYSTEMPVMFANSAINLNITLRSIGTGIPLRCLDVCAAGGFLLTNYQEELAEYFVDGQEIVMFTSRADMMTKIAYYLEHEEERIQIAKNGQKKVAELFSYESALEKMFQKIWG